MFKDNELTNEMDKLHRFALRLTKNHADADDLLQNTVLRAYEKKHLFKDGSNVFSWSSKIMYNLFVSDYRRRVKFESQYDPEPVLNNVSIDADQDDKIMMSEVNEAMKQLSDEHRDVLIMVTVQGMKYEEAADKLDVPVGTVRSRLSRARGMLMDLLDNESNDTGYSVQSTFGTQLAA